MQTNLHKERSMKRENLQSSSYQKTALKSAINYQSKASLQFPAIESQHNHINIGAPHFRGTAPKQSFLWLQWDIMWLCIDTIVIYGYQPQHWFSSSIVVLRLIMNVWFNSVQFTRHKVQNLIGSQYLGQICYQSWHWWVVLGMIRLPQNHPSYLTILSLHRCLSFVYQMLSLLYFLQYCLEEDSADMAQINSRKGSYTYDIGLLGSNLRCSILVR